MFTKKLENSDILEIKETTSASSIYLFKSIMHHKGAKYTNVKTEY